MYHVGMVFIESKEGMNILVCSMPRSYRSLSLIRVRRMGDCHNFCQFSPRRGEERESFSDVVVINKMVECVHNSKGIS